VTDDELLGQLAAAFAPEPVDPPAASIHALRRAVRANRPPVRSPRWRRVAVPALAGFTLVGAAGAAFAASGAVLPEPVRRVVHAVGLPVDSPALAEARAARAALRETLARGERARVAPEAARLRRDLEELGADERGGIEGDANNLLHQADALLATPPGSPPGPGPEGPDQGDGRRGSPHGIDQPATTSLAHSGGDQPADGQHSNPDSNQHGRVMTSPVESSGEGPQGATPPGPGHEGG
jgi:hypothetical protein